MDLTRLEAFLTRHGRCGALCHADGDQQRRRRAAREPREHSRGRRDRAPPRPPVHHRRLPIRRECLFHQDARSRPGRSSGQGDRPRHVRGCRRHDDVGQEGRVREHRGLARSERRDTRARSAQPPDPDRGFPDLWGPCGTRFGCDRPGFARNHRRELPALPIENLRVHRRALDGARHSDRQAHGRPCGVRRCPAHAQRIFRRFNIRVRRSRSHSTSKAESGPARSAP